LDENTFAIFNEIKSFTDTFTPQQAEEINAIFKDFPDYGWDESQERKLRAKLYKTILALVGKSKMIEPDLPMI
jgi:hypothetical protein